MARANRVNEMRWNWETPTTEAKAEALQERIWDLHDKLRHAILALSACAGLPACRCRGAPMVDARGLHAIRAALEDLEGHLHFLREQDIDVVAKELATCKLQLEAKESENKQANMKLEAMRKTMQDLS
ncbi:plastid division protein PDV1-like [Hordeum vulgare]|nr:plastid division protein PDV1-like [Hordeum vulgare]